jgi:hypothetical protein
MDDISKKEFTFVLNGKEVFAVTSAIRAATRGIRFNDIETPSNLNLKNLESAIDKLTEQMANQ